MFAQKPAPIQVTYLGYPDTSGLATMDYRLTDGLADPPGETERLHTEELVRLASTAWCYRPPDPSPPVGPPPAERLGHVTFGSFNFLAKVNASVIRVWSQISRRPMPRASRASRNCSPILSAISNRSFPGVGLVGLCPLV